MDIAHKYTDEQIIELEKRIHAVYAEAERDLSKKMKDFTDKYIAKEDIYQKKVDNGEITQEQFDNWKKGQVFQGKQWKDKREQVVHVLNNSNQVAINMINRQTAGIFAYNASYMNYSLEHGAGVNFGFGLYDVSTVNRLIANNPQMLPEWKINEKKDYIWNEKKINNAVTQGIIQGEKLDQITKRISEGLCAQNENLMKTFSRTAMTGAQNAGRLESLTFAKDAGIDVYKQWMATLDSHTRDSHADVDGESVPVNSKFSNGLEYPGEPGGAPAEVYNCRCTMVGDLKKYPAKYKRYNNEKGKPIQYMTYKNWAKSKSYGKQGLKASQESKNKLNQAKDELAKLQKEIADKGADKKFENIWYNQTVTYADWEAKKDFIQDKIDYYEKQVNKFQQNIDAGINDTAMLKKMQEKLNEVKEFQKYGAEYSALLKKAEEAEKLVKDLTPVKATKGYDKAAYTQARKDAAIWAQNPKDADAVLRGKSGEVWRNASKDERAAIYEYTQSYHKFNEPLRGWEYGQSNFKTGAGFKGVGNTDLNAGYANNGKNLNNMTAIIDKSTYNHDMWFQRGCRYDGMDKFFNCDMSLLQHGTQEELEKALLGTTPTEYGFMSMGSSKGQGFTGDIILNIYTPSGTKMMYVEPFSAFGDGDKMGWDGVSGQSYFGSELETILQQNTQFRVVKVERTGGTLYFDLDVIAQNEPQLWKP